MSRFINVQEIIKEIIEKKVSNILNAIRYTRNLPNNEILKNDYIKRLKNAYDKHYAFVYDWNLVFDRLYDAVKDIKIYKIPFKNKKEKLDYEKHENGLRTIVIGGLALSRGLTLEGLTISYLYRNTSTFDVLMQMGRWFGYRSKPVDYQDLCKVWMLKQTRDFFVEITESVAELKADFASMIKSKKTPREFGIRVRNESDNLGITASNKMRSTKKYISTYDLFGQVLETPFISSSKNDLLHNMNQVYKFAQDFSFQSDGSRYISKDIDSNSIINFINDFRVHDANFINYFQKAHLIDFMIKFRFKKFDVVIHSGQGNTLDIGKVKINAVKRQFDFLNSDILRISGKHRRVGGPGDTKHGLDSETIKKIDDEYGKGSSNSYLIEDRNPLLMIYPIVLTPIDNKDWKVTEEEEKSIISLVNDFERNRIIVYGIALAFPKNSKQVSLDSKKYYINDRTNWIELMKRKDDEEDEEL